MAVIGGKMKGKPAPKKGVPAPKKGGVQRKAVPMSGIIKRSKGGVGGQKAGALIGGFASKAVQGKSPGMMIGRPAPDPAPVAARQRGGPRGKAFAKNVAAIQNAAVASGRGGPRSKAMVAKRPQRKAV